MKSSFNFFFSASLALSSLSCNALASSKSFLCWIPISSIYFKSLSLSFKTSLMSLQKNGGLALVSVFILDMASAYIYFSCSVASGSLATPLSMKQNCPLSGVNLKAAWKCWVYSVIARSSEIFLPLVLSRMLFGS